MENKATMPVRFYGLVVAAGGGARFGGEIPKQYKSLAGIPLVRRALTALLSTRGLQGLAAVIADGHEALFQAAARDLGPIATVQGGADRQASVRKGLDSLAGQLGADDIVLIHDAARPFTRPEDIARVAEAAHAHGAACLGYPVVDTLRYGDGRYPSRDGLWALSTPQGFRYETICRAHAAGAGGHTDDTGLVQAAGGHVEIVRGTGINLKITMPEDWALAETIARNASETRTGSGFDVHAFAERPAGTVRIGGIDINHDRALEGHSDADVALHALTDALLGALALGDIGQHFPPSDPQWKGASSDIFLKHATRLVAEKGGRIVNLDLTVICEAPKIGPHRRVMQDQIAKICGIEPDRVSVKATTTERLGFTGRREGVAAQALATVEVPMGRSWI